MSKLIIGFSRPKSETALFGRTLMWYDDTSYSHVYIKFTTISGVTLISQASKGMLNFMSEEAFNAHNVVVEEYEFDIPDEKFTAIKVLAMEKSGFSYSIKQILGILVADIFKLKKNPFDLSKDTFVCSSYLAMIVAILGWELEKHESIVKPKDINALVKEEYDKHVRTLNGQS